VVVRLLLFGRVGHRVGDRDFRAKIARYRSPAQ
jgi:hypothetical protein